MIERIADAGTELALILRRDFRAEGIAFLTDAACSQQLGYMNRPVGHVIPPHVHKPAPREVHYTQEVLFVKSGRVRVDFYAEDRRYLESAVLQAGDVILLARGGHGFEMLEATEMIEVKQGPYVGEHDKTRFSPVPAAALRMRGQGGK